MKTIRIIQLAVLLFIIVGLIGLLIAFVSGKVSLPGNIFEIGVIEIFDEEYQADDIDEISFDLSSANVKIYRSESDKIRVVYEGPEKEAENADVSVRSSENKLSIIQKNRMEWFQWNTARRVTVYLPSSFDGDFVLVCSSGDVTIDGVQAFSEFESKMLSGNLNVDNLTCEKAVISASSGDIRIDSLTTETYSVKILSGNLSVNTMSGQGNISLTSGDISIDAYFGSGAIKAISGNVTIYISEVQGDIDVDVTSGDVRMELCEGIALRCDFKVTSGDIRTNFGEADEKIVGESLSTEVGNSPVYDLTITTISGNINVTQK
jgi:lia operon protein LiaG